MRSLAGPRFNICILHFFSTSDVVWRFEWCYNARVTDPLLHPSNSHPHCSLPAVCRTHPWSALLGVNCLYGVMLLPALPCPATTMFRSRRRSSAAAAAAAAINNQDSGDDRCELDCRSDSAVLSRDEWQKDEEAGRCSVCDSRFSYNPLHPQRRHHCRMCGSLVCSACSEGRILMQLDSTTAERACRVCASAAPRLYKLVATTVEMEQQLNRLNSKYSSNNNSSNNNNNKNSSSNSNSNIINNNNNRRIFSCQ
mmetsp:Transcript_80448/g.167598  ORF Transcript_80448/g.167598 Transcript_80448/m.167598 type:complete len:253 (+) Transcript_80448:111-869(+)